MSSAPPCGASAPRSSPRAWTAPASSARCATSSVVAPPRISGRVARRAAAGWVPHIDDLKRLAEGLDSSYLFIQGPPGSGKTWTGAQLIVHLIARGGSRRGGGDQPQGDPQPAARGRGSRRPDSTSTSAAGRSAPKTTPSRSSSRNSIARSSRTSRTCMPFHRPTTCVWSPAPRGCTRPSGHGRQPWTIS